jgi:hypothetical protein
MFVQAILIFKTITIKLLSNLSTPKLTFLIDEIGVNRWPGLF